MPQDWVIPRLYNASNLTRMLTRLDITIMLTRLESNLVSLPIWGGEGVFFWGEGYIFSLNWVVFHLRSSSIKGCLPLKVIFHQRSSSIKGLLPLKVVFHQRSSSIKGGLQSKVVFYQRSSSIKDRLPSKGVFHWPRTKDWQNFDLIYYYLI